MNKNLLFDLISILKKNIYYFSLILIFILLSATEAVSITSEDKIELAKGTPLYKYLTNQISYNYDYYNADILSKSTQHRLNLYIFQYFLQSELFLEAEFYKSKILQTSDIKNKIDDWIRKISFAGDIATLYINPLMSNDAIITKTLLTWKNSLISAWSLGTGNDVTPFASAFNQAIDVIITSCFSTIKNSNDLSLFDISLYSVTQFSSIFNNLLALPLIDLSAQEINNLLVVKEYLTLLYFSGNDKQLICKLLNIENNIYYVNNVISKIAEKLVSTTFFGDLNYDISKVKNRIDSSIQRINNLYIIYSKFFGPFKNDEIPETLYTNEPNDTISKASEILKNSTYTGNLSSYKDIDYYYFNIVSNGNVSISLRHQNPDLTNSTSSLWVTYLYKETDTVNSIHTLKLKGNESPATMFEGLPQGKYYIKIKTYNKDSWVPDAYYLTLNFTNSNYFEKTPNGTCENATFLELQKEYSANLAHYNDTDYYYIELPSNGNASILLNHKSNNLTNNSNLLWVAYLFREHNTVNALHTVILRGNNSPVSMLEGLPEGKYYIKIKTNNNESWVPEQYYIKVNFTNSNYFEKSPNGSIDNATFIEHQKEYSANLAHYNDIDYYYFELQSNGNATIILNHKSNNITNNTNLLWRAYLFSEHNTVDSLHAITLRGNNSPVSMSEGLPVGKYYIKIKAYNSSSWVPEQYYIKVNFTNSNYFEKYPNGSFDNATFIELQKEYSANLVYYNDIDYYYFELPSNGNASIILNHKSNNITNNTDSLWMAYLFSEHNTVDSLHTITLRGNNSPVSMSEGLPVGKYYIKIKAYNNSSWVPEQYYIKVNFTNSNYFEKSPNGSFDSATKIDFDKEYSGNLSSYKDIDYYTFNLSRPGKLLLKSLHNNDNLSSNTKTFWVFDLYSNNDKINSINTIHLKGNNSPNLKEMELTNGKYYIKVKSGGSGSSSWSSDQYYLCITFNNNKNIYGTVTTLVTGLSTPLENASVILSNGERYYTTLTSEVGNYYFESIESGIYNMQIQKEYFKTITEPSIEISANINSINLQHEMKFVDIECLYDINLDNKIGLEEAINILQTISNSK